MGYHGTYGNNVAKILTINRGIVNGVGPLVARDFIVGQNELAKRTFYLDASTSKSYDYSNYVYDSNSYDGASLLIPIGTINGAQFSKFYKGCFYFNNNASIIFNDSNALQKITGDISLCVWINTTTSIRKTVVHKFNNTTQKGYYADIMNTGVFRSGFQTSGSDYRVADSTTKVNDGKWHYCCMVREATNNARVYVDGRLEGTNTFSLGTTTAIDTSTVLFSIGTGYTSGQNYLGYVGVYEFWNKALTASEIWQNFQYMRGRYLV